MFGTGEKKQIGIWIFLVVQKINFLGPLKVNMDIVYFYMNFFHFTKKVPSALDHAGSFSNFFFLIFDIFYWFLLIDNITI